jgi:hypothetical protein
MVRFTGLELLAPEEVSPVPLLTTWLAVTTPTLGAELWKLTPTVLLTIKVLLIEIEFGLVALTVMPFAKLRMTLSSTCKAAPELNRIPFVPEPPPSISSPLKLTVSDGPALIVIPLTLVERTPAVPIVPMIVTA